MKNNMIEYNGTLGTIGTLVLAILLLPIFAGCTVKQANPRIDAETVSTDAQTTSTKQVNPKANPQVIPQTVKNALDSIVRLVMKDSEDKSLEIGSGFFVQPGLIVTNLHVVEGAASGYAKLVGQKAQYPIENIDRNEGHGLALLKVTAPDVEPLSIAEVQYQYGIPVYVEKNPAELGKILFLKGIVTYRTADNRTIIAGPGSTIVIDGKVIRGPYEVLPFIWATISQI